MDNDTDDTTETDAEITAPNGCDACIMGVELVDGLRIRACAHCSHTSRGHRTDREAADLVFEVLAALADIRELLWPIADPNAGWSPDTIEAVARRLEFLRRTPNYPAADAVRYSGSVRIELTYEDSDGCYDGKVAVDGHAYSVSVGPPVNGYWHARRPESFARSDIRALEWLRLPGDIVFILGGIAPLVYVALRMVANRDRPGTIPSRSAVDELTGPSWTPIGAAHYRGLRRSRRSRAAAGGWG